MSDYTKKLDANKLADFQNAFRKQAPMDNEEQDLKRKAELEALRKLQGISNAKGEK